MTEKPANVVYLPNKSPQADAVPLAQTFEEWQASIRRLDDQAAERAGYTQQVELWDGRFSGQSAGIATELTPIGQIETPVNEGGTVPSKVLARVQLSSTPSTFMLVEREGRYAGANVDANGRVSMIRMDESVPGESSVSLFSPKDGEGCRVTRSNNPDKDGYIWRFDPAGHGSKSTTLEVSNQVLINNDPDAPKNRQLAKEKWIRRGKKTLAAAAIWMTIKSGGLADQVGEKFVGTEGKVGVASGAPLEHYKAGDKWNYVPIDQEKADELNAKIDEANANERQAVECVNRTMEDLDGHNYDQIRQRAQEYLDKNPGSLMEAQKLDELRVHMNEATTNEEVISALRELADFYGIQVEYDEKMTDGAEVKLDTMRRTAGGIFEVISKLPKPVVEISQLEKISLTDVIPNLKSPLSLAGKYIYERNEIRMSYVSGLTKAIPGTEIDGTAENIFAHEFAHPLNMKGGIIAGDYKEHIKDFAPYSTIVDFLMGGVLNHPLSVSSYARKDNLESDAENIAGAYHEEKGGLAHPDDIRRFYSPATVAMLTSLVQLEKKLPGVTDYFVSQNSNLMKG